MSRPRTALWNYSQTVRKMRKTVKRTRPVRNTVKERKTRKTRKFRKTVPFRKTRSNSKFLSMNNILENFAAQPILPMSKLNLAFRLLPSDFRPKR